MDGTSENKQRKYISIALAAHVDAGKTTLSEGMLYVSGVIRKLGRVDHQNAFLDNYELERTRGITIFSKQAVIDWKSTKVMLLDTPGHADFSAEMERTLKVLDYAVLVISGSDGVQSHTETLWKLFEKYNIPVFIFVNKMDIAKDSEELVLEEIKRKLSDNCIVFSEDDSEKFYEMCALCDEAALDKYMETGRLEVKDTIELIYKRKLFPIYFGSALKLKGVEEFLDGIDKYTKNKKYPKEFAARVYKIGRDEQGVRLTYLKITGGKLRVKDKICKEQKAEQIRIYNGKKYDTVDEASAGIVCAVTGLSDTYSGQGLGAETEGEKPVLMPVMNYRLILQEGIDAVAVLPKIKELMEEEPLLNVSWRESHKEIHVQIMGNVQIEILKSMIKERFGLEVDFAEGSIVYKETIAAPVLGMGHYEPLRHYAEVHILMTPLERGSGFVFESNCSEDELDKNWQRLILTHLEEKEHIGVLTGASLTDIKFTLIAGRANIKHTEGGDFRQAVYRAVRHGLMNARNILLEPVYSFNMELPAENIGRAMSDIERMSGTFNPPEIYEDKAVLSGKVSVYEFQGYALEFVSYTKGRGKLNCIVDGYEICHNTEQIIEKIGYDAEADIDNSADSVFCSHGAGFLVHWSQAANFMHIESKIKPDLSYLKIKRAGQDDVYVNVKDTEIDLDIKNTINQNVKDISSKGSIENAESSRESVGISKKNAKGIENAENGLKNIINGRESIENKQINTISSKKDAKDSQANQKISKTKGDKGKTEKKQKSASIEEDKELEEIFERTYGPIKTRYANTFKTLGVESKNKVNIPKVEVIPEYLLVDGYNIIFAWEELNELAEENLSSARIRLMDILCNYQGYINKEVILVFDGYKVAGNKGEVSNYNNIHIVYTKEAETADMYIEKVTHEIGRKYKVTVATSDALEQTIVIGQGAERISARGFKEEVEQVTTHKLKEFIENNKIIKAYAIKDALDKLN